MKTPARLSIAFAAFSTALIAGAACDVALPTTVPTSPKGVVEAGKGAACPEMTASSVIGATFTQNAELNAQIGAFVQASKDIGRLADQSYANVTAACVQMGKDLGVPEDKLKGEATDKASGPCKAVAAQMDAIIKANAAVEVAYEPPRCQMDANFKASCEAECGVEVEPAKVVAECEPAQLSGYCQGTCGGQCEGTCTGTCEGQCSAKDAEGRCVGECSGTCSGSCDATCHATCEGQWKAPRCEAEIQPGSAKAECSANCEASAKVRASCQPPKLTVDADASAEAMAKLNATLKANLPALIQAQVRLGQQLAGDIKVVVDTGKKIQGSMATAGGKAVACVGAAVSALAEASVKVNISVQASASVSGSANAKASGS